MSAAVVDAFGLECLAALTDEEDDDAERGVGRDADVWDDPLQFHPDRFLDMTDDRRAAADAAWIPFGGGRRNCIGFALAHMELTLLTV